jgi:undecaprenyl diphosphate synthase
MMAQVEELTEHHSDCHVIVAVSYGGRDEIVYAANRAIAGGRLLLTQKDFDSNLYMPNIPSPDMIVRTGKTYRLSNFLVWQGVYAEYLFLEKLWPDISVDDVNKCREVYITRDRRFGR